MNIDSFSNCENKSEFLKSFTHFNMPQGRPRISADYEHLVINLFPDKKKEFFIARDAKGNIIGKIGVSLFADNTDAVFGFFELDDIHSLCQTAFDELEALVISWARENGAENIYGPVNYNTWFTNRFKTYSLDQNHSWEPHNLSSYPILFEKSGWQKNKEYISKFYDTNELILKRTKKSYDKSLEEGYSFRPIEIKKEGEGDILYELNCNSFQENYLFEPITRKQYEMAFLQMISGSDLSLCYFILDENNKEQGYIYSYIDEFGYQIIKSILVDPHIRGAGLSSALVHKSILEASHKGVGKLCGALVRRGNISEYFFDTLGEPVRKHIYTLYKKKLIP